MRTENLTQTIAVAAHIPPAAARAAGSYVTPAIEAKHFDRLTALLDVGTLSGAATVLAKYQHCSVSASSAAAWAVAAIAVPASSFTSSETTRAP